MSGANTAVPTTHIDCRTPELGTIGSDNAIYDGESLGAVRDLSLHHANPIVIALPDHDQVGPIVTLAGTLSQLEQLLL